MLVDVRCLKKEEEPFLKVEGLEGNINNLGDFRLKAPFEVKAYIFKTEKGYVAEIQAKGVLLTFCSRCLKEVELPTDNSFTVEFVKGSSLNDEFYDYEDELLDLTPPLREAIILNLPMKVLCQEECKGLCPICGQDLNESDCHCRDEFIDPRWDVLRQSFN